MSLSLDEIRLLCTKAEFALISASRSPAIEKLSVVELKKNAANARKLSDKWQKLSRGQSRSESRNTGEPNLDSKSYAKQQALHDALVAYEAQLVTASSTTTVTAAAKKLTPKQRTASARVSRQAARTELQGVKKTLNKAAKTTSRKAAAAKPAAAPAPQSVATPKPAAAKPAAKSVTSKSAAAKKTLVKTAAKRTAKRAAVASTVPTSPVKKVVKETAKTGIVVPTPAAKAQLAGRAKANRVKLSNRTSNIAGHVSGKGKRAQAKRDSKGR
ncbi:MAG: hypothetical protein ACKO3V_17500 [Pirellula sp.]